MKYDISGNTDLYEYLVAHSCRPNEHLEGLHKVSLLTINAFNGCRILENVCDLLPNVRREQSHFCLHTIQTAAARKCCAENLVALSCNSTVYLHGLP